MLIKTNVKEKVNMNKQELVKSMAEKMPEGTTLKVTEAALNAFLESVTSALAKNDEVVSAIKTQKEQVLENIITTKVIEQKAKELKLLPDESKLKSDMDKKIDDIKKQNFKGDTSQFDAALKAQGFTEESFKTMFLSQLKTQAIETNVSNYLAKNVKITDKQIKDYYNANKDKYTEQPDKMHLAHILVKTKDEAQKVKARLNKGEDFAKVAKEVSQDTATKDKGGDLGFVNYNDSGYDAQFMAGAKKLKEGVISDPVQSSFGYHIIKCIKKQEYPVKDFNKVKDEIKKQLESDQKSKLVSQKVQEWKKAASITKKEKNIM